MNNHKLLPENKMISGTCAVQTRLVIGIGNEIVDGLEKITNRAEELAKRVNDRLNPISIPYRGNSVLDNEVKTPGKEYPPYFDTIRERCLRLDAALDSINDSLDRLEL